MNPILALDASAARVVHLVGQVDRSDWARPTPCTEWNVRELVGHLIVGMSGYVDLLHGGPASGLSSLVERQAVAGGDDLPAAVTAAAAAVRAAFAEPGALERTVHHLIGDAPRRTPAPDAAVQERLLILAGR